MKAGIYLGKENIEIRELPLPEVDDNDVLIKNIYSSICGTDVAVFTHGPNTGHKVTVGGEFGHETISKVVKVGKNIKDFTVGERVYPYPRYAKDDTRRAQQSIIGSGGYMPEDVHDVQDIMSCGKWDLESIITHEFPLEQLETAIRTAGDVSASGNVVIKMD